MITIDIQQAQKKKKKHKTEKKNFKLQNDLNSYIKGKYINATYEGRGKKTAVLAAAIIVVTVIAGMKIIGII